MKRAVCIVLLHFGILAFGQPTGQPGNMAGMAVLMIDDGYRDMDSRMLAVPFVRFEKGRFFLNGPSLGFHLYQDGTSSVSAVLTAGFGGYDARDSTYFTGMADRDFSVFAGIQWERRFDRKYVLSLMAGTDVTGHADGMMGRATVTRNWFAGKWMVMGSLSVDWISEDVTDYYYGVRPGEARPDRPAYRGTATWNPGCSLMATRSLGARMVFTAMVGYARYGSGITDSPLVAQDQSLFGMLGLGWTF